MNKFYSMVCLSCGFEYEVYCDEKDFEESKETILRCPCGDTMKCTEDE